MLHGAGQFLFGRWCACARENVLRGQRLHEGRSLQRLGTRVSVVVDDPGRRAILEEEILLVHR